MTTISSLKLIDKQKY